MVGTALAMRIGGGLVAKSCLSSFMTLATSWTVACQAPLSMGFSRQEYWNGSLLHPEIESGLPHCRQILGFPGGSDGKESACNAGDQGSIPGSRRSPGEGNGYPFQYSCLKNFMNRETWWTTVPGITKNQTQLSN